MAAGRGSRLGSNTDEKPKAYTQVGGKPLIRWQIEALKRGGVDSIAIAVGYRSESFKDLGADLVLNKHWASTNMVSTLLCARAFFDKPLIVSYSDIIYPASIVKSLVNSTPDPTIAYDPDWKSQWESRFDRPQDDAESFELDSEGRLLDIGQKVQDITDVKGQYLGLMKFTPGFFDALTKWAEENEAVLNRTDMTTLLRKFLDRGHRIMCEPVKESWFEVDTETDLDIANRWFEEGRFNEHG